MTVRTLLATLLLAAAPAAAHAQDSLRAQYDSGYVAWQNGDYPHALERLERLLRAPGGDALLRDVALLTGELYTVEE
ncbi:MAG: hypothetical protein HY561_13455, partial [Gemmatimonadetes bacterium]|nr:hypothetical protein [Gemmatimonadota bacterium]